MSDVPGLYRQGRPLPSPFPPYPWLELHSRYGSDVYLIMPRSVATSDVRRFEVFGHGEGWHRDIIGKMRLEHLLDELKNGYSTFGSGTDEIGAIRNFDSQWRHVGSMKQPRELIDQLKRDIEQGSLAVFRFERRPHWGLIRQNPGEPVPQASGSVATWDGRQKVVAMFRAIPDYLEGAAKAEFEAFLTPENLTIMAVFLGGIGALQAIPGADGVVDGMIAALAWWQFGWAGVIAGKDFVEAVIKANRATTHDEIMLAAKLAAAALVSLGITVLLQKITENVHEVRWKAKDEPLADQPKTNSENRHSGSTLSKSSWSYEPKKIGQTEPGAVEETPELRAQMDEAANRSAMSADGYPDLPTEAARTFGGTPQPWNGNDENGLISRIIGQPSSANGSFWSQGLPPSSESEWRANSAVLNDWNGDGGYVTADPSNLTGWIGPAAPQISSDGTSVLPGQGLQIWIPKGSASPSMPIPTPWNAGK